MNSSDDINGKKTFLGKKRSVDQKMDIIKKLGGYSEIEEEKSQFFKKLEKKEENLDKERNKSKKSFFETVKSEIM